MIIKFLLIMAVIAIVYFMFFKIKPSTQQRKRREKNSSQTPVVNDMVECKTCGVYVEIEEAILSNGKYYCSSECLKEAN